MANERGMYGKNGVSARETYGTPLIGADSSGQRGSSFGKWIIGGIVVGGAFLWARHQSEQIAKLHQATGLQYQSFLESISERARALPSATREKFQGLTRGLRAKKSEVP